MKTIRSSAAPTLLVLGLAAAVPAFATGACPIQQGAPKAEWQTTDALQKKLVAAGWQVRRIKVDGACYEVYGTDREGHRVEAYFDPKTLEAAKKAS